MGRVVIAKVNESSPSAFPSLGGVSAVGGVESKPVVTGEDRSLILWQHTLVPGSEIHWNRPPVGHLIYAWSGGAEASGRRLDEDGTLIIEHGGQAVLRAGATPVTVLHFFRPLEASPARAGGGVHVINHADALHYAIPEVDGTVFADSSCPTCEFWFHRNDFCGAKVAGRHLHTEDEIIFVVAGSMTLGRRQLAPGSALAIDAHTVYTFAAGEGGLSIVNFRAQDPYFVVVTPEGKSEPLREYEFVHDAAAKTRLANAGSGTATH
jgi:hypothetical protein